MVESVIHDIFTEHKLSGIQIMMDEIQIEPLSKKDEWVVSQMIHRNLGGLSDSEVLVSAIDRRTRNLSNAYSGEGCELLIAKLPSSNEVVGCVGLGPLHGLPSSEGVGEIRDLVVEEKYRGFRIGSKLLHRSMAEARKFGYQRLYLETSQDMIHAQKLFIRNGFRPVTERSQANEESKTVDLPCYYLLENLEQLHQ